MSSTSWLSSQESGVCLRFALRRFLLMGEFYIYRDRLKGLYVVGRSLFLLLLHCSAWPCLGPAKQDLLTFKPVSVEPTTHSTYTAVANGFLNSAPPPPEKRVHAYIALLFWGIFFTPSHKWALACQCLRCLHARPAAHGQFRKEGGKRGEEGNSEIGGLQLVGLLLGSFCHFPLIFLPSLLPSSSLSSFPPYSRKTFRGKGPREERGLFRKI